MNCPYESLKEGEVCSATDCPYHVFSDEIYLPTTRNSKPWEKHYTKDVVNLKACLKYLDHPMSLTEVANIYGLTREGVRYVEEHALKKVMFSFLNIPDARHFVELRFHFRSSRRVWPEGEGRYTKTQESVYERHLKHKPYQRRGKRVTNNKIHQLQG